MKKMIVIFVLILSCFGSLSAQTRDEWFRQKKTQLTYLTQQIAALQVYKGYLIKGYQIARQGLGTIGKGKRAELNLHHELFASLSKVNPTIQQYGRIADIIALQYNTLAQYERCMKEAQGSQQLTRNEIGYITSVFATLLKDCANDISDLISLTTDNQMQLSDDERLRRIDGIYSRMLDRNEFTQSFSNEVSVLESNRKKEQNQTSSIKGLFNLKQ